MCNLYGIEFNTFQTLWRSQNIFSMGVVVGGIYNAFLWIQEYYIIVSLLDNDKWL